MNTKLLILCFLIPSYAYGMHANKRTKNSIQNRQARQIKAAQELKKRNDLAKKEAYIKKAKEALERYKKNVPAPSPDADWQQRWIYGYNLGLREKAAQGIDISRARPATEALDRWLTW